MECLFECVNYFYHEGYQAKALEAAAQLSSLAALHGDPRWVRKGLTAAGVVNADVGNSGEALVHYARALQLSSELNDAEAQIHVLINVGVAMNYAGLYREAIPCLQRAANLSCGMRERKYLECKARINLAQSHLYLEEFSEGFRAADVAINETPAPTTTAERVSLIIKELTYVHLALELGKLNSARAHSKNCDSQARACDTPRARVLADIALGMCEVHGGKAEHGLGMLEAALERSSQTEPWRAAALTALVKAYDVAGNPERALEHLKSLLDYIRVQRQKGLNALLTINIGDETSAHADLQALELREARLHARVAEREGEWHRIEMMERLAVTADLKEELSGEHGYRVAKLSSLLAEAIGWSVHEVRALDIAARLHDIGKIAVPDRILLNSKELQEAERHFMSAHTTIGAELLAKSNIPQLRMAEEIAHHHHEWWSGEGYPSKLKGKRIPTHARIVALADVFDALTHGRPFAPAWSIDKALEEILSRKGTQFDPDLTDLFLDLVGKLRKEHENLDEYLGRAGRNSPFLQARNKIRMMLAEQRENEKTANVTGNQTRH
jgi:putative two-component system response regulator